MNVKLALEMLKKEQTAAEMERSAVYHEIISKSSFRIEDFITEILNLSKN